MAFVREGQHKKKKKGHKGSANGQSYGLYSGSGQWYPDVGDDHSLCDKDCGWCGHCADNVKY
jgi:hypothetical protein